MNRRRRRRYKYDDTYQNNNNQILLAEFRFYNKQKTIIDDKILVDIQKNMITNNETKKYWSNKDFAEQKISFLITKETNDKKINEFYISIIELNQKFDYKEIIKAKNIIKGCIISQFALNINQTAIIDNLNFKEIENKLFIVKDWDEMFKVIIKQKMLHGYKFDTPIILSNIFPELHDINAPKYNINRDDVYNNLNIFHIYKVIEKRIDNKNYRVALVSKINYYNNPNEIICFNEDDIDYNYIDEQRIFFISNDNRYFLDLNLNQYSSNGDIIINISLFNLMCENISQILGNEKVINQQIYNFYSDRIMTFEFDNKNKLTIEEEKIIQQYMKLLKDNKKIRINQIVIDKNLIDVDNGTFTIQFKEDFLNIYDIFVKLKQMINDNEIRYNFDVLFKNLLKLSSLHIIDKKNVTENNYKEFESISFMVNNLPITVAKENNRIKINGIFCRIDDIIYILNKAICFQKIEEFNQYVKEVSFIGIQWKKMISNGISITLSNPMNIIFKKLYNEPFKKLFIRFSLLWDIEKRRNVYLILNEKKYLISQKAKFKKLFDYPNRLITISRLKKELNDCIKDINDDILIEIVENAIEEAKIIQQKGEQLVKDTIKEVNATETAIIINGHEHNGFILKGLKTETKYFIKKSDLSVYRYDNGKWNKRCVINDSRKQRIFEDHLANRLINIYNEPDKIYTLHK